ncbi:MAG: RNase adapter RapZ [Endozoicomonas sp. (ex Botrylloides leachii)]|nr:RNase adapter RapZ [Endozoicomonas sp. (ex Botrylloides leachii)]
MKLVIISGRSGSGKSSALHALEDEGYYCADNIPVSILDQLPITLKKTHKTPPAMAVSIDVRNVPGAMESFPSVLKQLREQQIDCKVIFLDADSNTLLKRYSSTRRRHPLTNDNCSLAEAIDYEVQLLAPVQSHATVKIDTSPLSVHQIRERMRAECTGSGAKERKITLLIQSFGFKHGVPIDADFVFDTRCLPNPFWVESLRGYSGLEKPIHDFLAAEAEVSDMFNDISSFITRWLPRFESGQRTYMTIAIGCTGGQHRSVYLAETLGKSLKSQLTNKIQVRHRELPEL